VKFPAPREAEEAPGNGCAARDQRSPLEGDRGGDTGEPQDQSCGIVGVLRAADS
jgi:hypothetical protein